MNSLARYVEAAKEWLRDSCTGEFSGFVLGKELGIDDAATRNEVMADLCGLNLIAPSTGKHGVFAKVFPAKEIDWRNATKDFYPVWMPFDLHKLAALRRKNVVVVAGEGGAGKTLFALRVAYHNLRCNGGQHDRVNYLNSEMDPSEFRGRLEGIDPAHGSWNGLTTYEKYEKFHEEMQPDGLNIVDYLEMNSNFYLVGDRIKEIHESLKSGVCFVVIQKAAGAMLGRGGEFTTQRPRLALSLSRSHGNAYVRITKCKCPAPGQKNPEDLERDYRVSADGNRFEEISGWRYVDEKGRKDLTRQYEQQRMARTYTDRWTEE